MAERRMFAKTIIDSDAFMDMPLSTQALYFHLAMRADDDGFINNPKKIQRMIGASDDDSKLLILKQYIIAFETGVIVIKHWKMHNYIRKDTYNPTPYIEERETLILDQNNTYASVQSDSWTARGRLVDGSSTQVRLGKDRLGKDSIDNTIAPSEKEKSVISLPLNTNDEYPITEKHIEEWTKLYPAVDVMQQLRNMRGWLQSNPTKRKTKQGVLRFVTAWLSREQDKGGQATSRQMSTAKDYNAAVGDYEREAIERNKAIIAARRKNEGINS